MFAVTVGFGFNFAYVLAFALLGSCTVYILHGKYQYEKGPVI